MRKNITLQQFFITPAAGKRLIARSFVYIPEILRALKNQTVVIIAGTTNGYVAEEILKHLDQADGFDKGRFYRGITLPPHYEGNKPSSEFPGDIVIEKGIWNKGKTQFLY